MAIARSMSQVEERYEVWNTLLTVFGLSSVFRVSSGRYAVSYTRIAYSLLIALLLVSLCASEIACIEFESKNIGYMIMKVYLNVVGNLVAILTIFSAILMSEEMKIMKDNFRKLDPMFASIKVRVDATQFTLKYAGIPVFIFFVSLFCDFVHYFLDSDKSVLNVFSAHIALLYVILHIMQYSTSLFCVKASLQKINMVLEDRFRGIGKEREVEGLVGLRGICECSAEPSYWTPQTEALRYGMRSQALVDLFTLRMLYHDLFLLSKEVNKVHASRNLLTVSHEFILSTIFLYSLITELIALKDQQLSLELVEMLVYCKWSILSILAIFGLIWPSRMASREANKTVIIIHELLITVKEPLLRSQLHSFALQFLHYKIYFSPHNLFSLNNELLLSILAAVASYLVVLIQFRVPVE